MFALALAQRRQAVFEHAHRRPPILRRSPRARLEHGDCPQQDPLSLIERPVPFVDRNQSPVRQVADERLSHVAFVQRDGLRRVAGLFRRVWSLGRAGVEVPLLIYRDGRTFEVRVTSGDRYRFLKGPSLH